MYMYMTVHHGDHDPFVRASLVNTHSGQCEKHFPNGTKEITFPDQTLKMVHPSGEEETHFPDGTLQKTLPDGDMTLFYANGQKEIYTKEFKVYKPSNCICVCQM
jgi:hypothetical protein